MENIKLYKVTKMVYAPNLQEILNIEKGGQIIDIELQDSIKQFHETGFTKKYDEKT